jgi:hypothetical protein
MQPDVGEHISSALEERAEDFGRALSLEAQSELFDGDTPLSFSSRRFSREGVQPTR